MSSLQMICGLGLPQSKILVTPMNWKSPEKLFWKPFFLEHLRLCLWFLALASSIPILGLERVCPRKGCPSPWPRIFFVFLALALFKTTVSWTGCVITVKHNLKLSWETNFVDFSIRAVRLWSKTTHWFFPKNLYRQTASAPEYSARGRSLSKRIRLGLKSEIALGSKSAARWLHKILQ